MRIAFVSEHASPLAALGGVELQDGLRLTIDALAAEARESPMGVLSR